MIQDRALRAGAIDPFTTPDVRGEILGALRELRRDGRIRRTSTGVFELADAYGR
ncbi:MAG TPA: hypothetical protein VE032_04780 [Actinomycetota bacterium]|nr:hypothetical protein [Actinomycetota bacterium]